MKSIIRWGSNHSPSSEEKYIEEVCREDIPMNSGLQIAIDHETEVIKSAKSVLNILKTKTLNYKELDNCSDELSKIVASSELFLKFLKQNAE